MPARKPAAKRTAPVKRTAPSADAQTIADLQAQITALTAAATEVPADFDHVSDADLADAQPGQVVRYLTNPANGDAAAELYGLVLNVAEVDAATGGEPIDGQPTRTEVQVAALDVLHNRVSADRVLDLTG